MLNQKRKREDEVPVNKYEFVTSKDIDYVTGKEIPWTWPRFNDIWNEDHATGNFHKSIEVAMSILAPVLQKKKQELIGTRACSDDDRDLYQNVYITVMERIADFDPTRGFNFGTFISPYITGITREIKTGGMSNNDIKNGFRIYSTDGLKDKDGEKNESYEVVDTKSDVDGIYSEREKKRSSRAFTRMVNMSEKTVTSVSKSKADAKMSEKEKNKAKNKEDEKAETQKYVTAAFFSKFFGGFENMKEAMQEELENELEIV